MTKADPLDQIDLELLQLAFPSNEKCELILWIEPIRSACREFGIDTIREISSFLANIAVESNDLRWLEESFNYSQEGLRATFGRHRISDYQCETLGRKKGERRVPRSRQRKIANILYGGVWGRKNLGNRFPDDGWKFRGYGPKQLTGRDNCERFGQAIGMKVDDVPDYLRTREGGMRGAGWFWKSNGLDHEAATPGVYDDRKKINGGLNGVERVRQRFNLLVTEFLNRGC